MNWWSKLCFGRWVWLRDREAKRHRKWKGFVICYLKHTTSWPGQAADLPEAHREACYVRYLTVDRSFGRTILVPNLSVYIPSLSCSSRRRTVDFDLLKHSEAMIHSARQHRPDSGDTLARDSATAASSNHSMFQGILIKPAVSKEC